VLLRGMAKRPEDRWASAGEFSQAVDAALGPPVSPASRPTGRAAVASRERPGSPPPPRIHERPAPARHRRRRGAALAALAAAVLGVGVAAADSGLFGSSHPAASNHPARNLNAARPRTAATVHHAHVRKHHAAPRTRPTTTTTSTVQASPAAATTPPPTADTLQAQGHELLQDGQYAAAIPAIRRALSAAPPGSLTYAYALFDLGRALLLSGDPKAAVEVLWQRMQIPNQTGVVRAELQDALRALGKQANTGGPPGPAGPPGPPGGPGPGPGHGHGRGHGDGHGHGAGGQGPFS
jgi:hypothetical protein